MRFLRAIVSVLILLLGSFYARAQGFSNQGTEFWTTYLDHIDGAVIPGSIMALYITADVNTTATVSIADGSFSQSYPVVAGNILTVKIPASAFLGDVQGQFLKGIHIVSEKPIAVYAHIYAQNVSGATLLLPVNTLGKDYLSINYTQKSNSLNSQQEKKESYSTFAVIATEDNTTVEITPASKLLDGKNAGTPFNVVLKKGEVYQGLSLNDLTGTHIRSISTDAGSCKKVAVFSGSSKIAIGCNPNAFSSDNLFQQVYPTSVWGKNYITAPLKGRNYDVFRIILSDPSTQVKRNGSIISPGQFINGLYCEFNSKENNFISANKPIQVVQYAVSQMQSINCDDPLTIDTGDPEMIYLNPLEQTIDHVTLNSTSNYRISANFINVVIKTGTVPTFQLDGAPYTDFTVVTQNTAYSYAQISVASGVHHISAADGFNAIAYGFGTTESYGYAAGTNLKNLNEFITLKDPLSVTTQANGCSGVAYKLQLTLPFQTSSIKWDLKNGTVVNQPNPVGTPINPTGTKVLYVYQYPGILPPYTAGDYSIVATVFNPVADGCNSYEDVEFDFNVAKYPVAEATFVKACLGQPVAFTDASETFGNSVKTWLWDFGDGQTSPLKNPTHIYTSANDFQVHLTVTNQNGCIDVSDMIPVHVTALPVSDFDFSTPDCETRDITFTDKSTTTSEPITKWTWDFGDGSPVVERGDNLPFTHNYPITGTFAVKLTVANANGCTGDVKSQPVTIHELPVVDFTLPDACTADFATFTDKSTIADNTEADFTYLWNFGDVNANAGNPNTSTDKNPKHRFIDAQLNYTVKLTVKSKYGCEVTTSHSFRVNGDNLKADIAVLNPADLCSNREVFFENRSTVNVGNVTRIEVTYDITDPSTKVVYDHPASGQLLRHVYPQFTNPTKNYQVQIVAYSGDACGDVKPPVTITLKGTPIVTFAPVSGICPEKDPIQLTSLPPEGPVGTGVFSGAGVSAGGVFSPAVAGSGTFNIQYIYTSQNICADTVFIPITVYPSPTVSAGNDVQILEGLHTTLTPTVSGHNLTYKWVPSTGLDHDDVLNPVASPTETTPYKLIVTSAEECSASADVTVSVLKYLQVPNTFTPNGDGRNDVWEIKYLATYPGNTVDIFNRYGQKLFSSVGYNVPWDGTYKGSAVPPGTYYYIIDPKNGRKVISGNVTIIR